jgi:hypothetical protein
MICLQETEASEKLIVTVPFKKFSAFCETWKFVTLLNLAHGLAPYFLKMHFNIILFTLK